MRRISTFIYQIGQGFVGVFRNGVMSFASLLVLVSCMLIVGTFYMVIDNIDKNLKSTDDINIIYVYLPEGLTDEQTLDINEQIKKIGEEIGNIVDWQSYSKEQNFERYKNRAGVSAKFLDIYNEHNNPLPSSIEIRFTSFSSADFNMDDVFKLKNRLESIEYISNEDIKENLALYEKVTGLNKTLTLVAAWMMAILLVVSLFVIMNTIKLGLHARRNEITFMRYCGATKSFIRTPFIIEGIIIGIFSAGVALGLQYYIYEFIISDAMAGGTGSIIESIDSVTALSLAPFSDYLQLLAAAFLGLGFFAGVISSTISLKKHLKV